MDTEKNYRAMDNWLRIINQVLYIYRDTSVPKPKTVDELIVDAHKLIAGAEDKGE